MIVEMRTYDLHIGAVPEYEKHFESGLAHRLQYSALGAFFHVEFGPLNRIMHFWPYENLAERDRIRAEAAQPGKWPPEGEELIVAQENKILTPAPFSPPLRPGKYGNFYEIRTYTLKPGTLPKLLQAWEVAIEERTKFSPLAFAGSVSTIGPLNQWVHIWPYESIEERTRIRAEAAKSGNWPPKTHEFLVKQESWIAVPASYSPMH